MNLLAELEVNNEAALNKVETLQAYTQMGEERMSSCIAEMEDVTK